MVPIKKRAGVIPYIFSSLLSCSFYLLDQRTISGVEILKMTGKTAQSYYVLNTATFQAYRRLTVKCVRSRNVPIIIANAHAYMLMRIRNVRTYGFHHIYIYIYTALLIIEHPREWLASLADYLYKHLLVTVER